MAASEFASSCVPYRCDIESKRVRAAHDTLFVCGDVSFRESTLSMSYASSSSSFSRQQWDWDALKSTAPLYGY